MPLKRGTLVKELDGGHSIKDCNENVGEDSTYESSCTYGPWLRASPVKPKVFTEENAKRSLGVRHMFFKLSVPTGEVAGNETRMEKWWSVQGTNDEKTSDSMEKPHNLDVVFFSKREVAALSLSNCQGIEACDKGPSLQCTRKGKRVLIPRTTLLAKPSNGSENKAGNT
ncbi:uncharacterized protein G2W53_000862 [Senna tora]|uniref:Uncharacterized protein n=1 Tax=Senna tora TaxID=362788 RepID=A0A834XF48_9FABA|nr:uncharacterized protein G2W53_000862 [Senna tora]